MPKLALFNKHSFACSWMTLIFLKALTLRRYQIMCVATHNFLLKNQLANVSLSVLNKSRSKNSEPIFYINTNQFFTFSKWKKSILQEKKGKTVCGLNFPEARENLGGYIHTSNWNQSAKSARCLAIEPNPNLVRP